ncbi:hypothetical protein SCA6_012787 [Theobroma cacao]
MGDGGFFLAVQRVGHMAGKGCAGALTLPFTLWRGPCGHPCGQDLKAPIAIRIQGALTNFMVARPSQKAGLRAAFEWRKWSVKTIKA